MADFISTSPEFSHEPLTLKVEVVSLVHENPKIGNVIIDINNLVAKIIVPAEARQQSKELKKEIDYSNKEITFLKKLYSTTNNSEIKLSIEHKTIKIYEIEWTDKIAISLDSKNVDYIFNNDWNLFFSFKWKRDDKKLAYPAFLGFSSWDFSEVDKWNGIYKIIINWNEVSPLSKEWINEYYKWAKFMDVNIKKLEFIRDNWDEIDKE